MEKNNRILVADDEEFALKLICEDLEDAGFEVVKAEDGCIALNILAEDQKFDVIILDRMMPNMNGIEVLTHIKQDNQTKHIPVIIQTAAGSPEQIQEGIDTGAYYYLTKPFEPKVMLAIIRSAIRENTPQDSDIDIEKTFYLAKSCKFNFRTLEDITNISILISRFYPEPSTILTGITELMVNAVEHGNLGISYNEKTDLLIENKLYEEIEKRLKMPEYKDKYASIDLNIQQNNITLTIEDQGDGFDWQSYIDFGADRASQPNGRGISISQSLSFDKIEYQGKGNKVVCSLKLES